MTIRCGLCGYENSDSYRFCGMCGAALHAPEPAPMAPVHAARPAEPPRQWPAQAPRPEPTPQKSIPVTGPSFLGLSQEPEKTSGVEYLLEDEEPHGHAGTVVVVVLLIAIGAAAWYWRASYLPLIAKVVPSVSNAPVNGSTTAIASQSPGVPSVGSGVATAPEPSQPMAPSGTTSNRAQTQPPAPTPSDESHMVVPDDASQTPPAKQHSETSQNTAAPAAPSAPTPESNDDAEPSDDESTAAADTTDQTPPKPAVKPTRQVAKPQPKPEPKPVGTADDRLVADGQRYLYGDGVTQNCDRARGSLTTAAGHNNPQAQSILGTMYATGHCVSRDLPAAYRWFARALHAEPGNDRVKQDLEVLWRQMSPDERQIAMRSE